MIVMIIGCGLVAVLAVMMIADWVMTRADEEDMQD